MNQEPEPSYSVFHFTHVYLESLNQEPEPNNSVFPFTHVYPESLNQDPEPTTTPFLWTHILLIFLNPEPRTRTKLFSFPFHLCLSWILHSFGLTFMLLNFLNLRTKNQNQTIQFSLSLMFILNLWTRIQNQLLLHSFWLTFMLLIFLNLRTRNQNQTIQYSLSLKFILNLWTRIQNQLYTTPFLWLTFMLLILLNLWGKNQILLNIFVILALNSFTHFQRTCQLWAMYNYALHLLLQLWLFCRLVSS